MNIEATYKTIKGTIVTRKLVTKHRLLTLMSKGVLKHVTVDGVITYDMDKVVNHLI